MSKQTYNTRVIADELWPKLAAALGFGDTSGGNIARAELILEPKQPVRVLLEVFVDERIMAIDWPTFDTSQIDEVQS